MTARYLTVEEVAERLRCSTRSIHELTRRREIPHRRFPGTRRCLFDLEDLQEWESGCGLEAIELGRGGRIVRPAGRDRRERRARGGCGDALPR
jgi:excisionase family DNA binding protein